MEDNTSTTDMWDVTDSHGTTRLTIMICYLATIGIVGILGNMLAFFVYKTRFKESNSQCFFLCLSTIDLFSCLVDVPFEIFNVVHQYSFPFTVLCKVYIFLNIWPTVSSAFLLILIAVDRYRKICCPFSRQISVRQTKILSLSIIFLALFLTWPSMILYGQRTVRVPGYNVSGTECSIRNAMVFTPYPFIYNVTFWIITVIGLSCISVLYYSIVKTVRNQEKKKLKNFKVSSKRKRPFPEKMQNGVTSGVEGEAVKLNNRLVSEQFSDVNRRRSSLRGKTWKKMAISCDDEFSPPVMDIEITVSNDDNLTEDRPDSENAEEDDTLDTLDDCSLELVTEDTLVDTKSREICNEAGLKKGVARRGTSRGSKRTVGCSKYMGSKRAKKTTLIMLMITVCAILSYIPYLILASGRAINAEFEDNMTHGERTAYTFFIRSYFLNAMLNPFIYGAYDSRFRAACLDIFRK